MQPAAPPAIAPAPLGWPARGLILATSLAVLLPGIFSVSLTDRDEGWYAQVCREMLASDNWLIPHYLDEPWLAKPPLLYWCVTPLYALFGVHAGVARLVSVLAVTLSVQLLATLAAEMFNRRVALITALSFITAGLPAIVGKMLLTDGVLLLCITAATLVLWRIARRGATWTRGPFFWALLGVGILAKGPAIVVFTGAFGLGLLAHRDTRTALFRPAFWLAAPLALLVAAPWYLYAASQVGGTLVSQFFGYEIVSRITGAPHGHGGPPGYYILLSLAGWLPWTALVPGAVLDLIRERHTERWFRLLIIWCLLPWIFLELIHSKLPHYILPCYLPLAIMLGRMWDLGLQRPVARPQWLALGIWVAIPLILGLLLAIAAVGWWDEAWSIAGIATGVAMVVGFALVARFVKQQKLHAAWTAAVTSTVAFHLLLGFWLLPGLEPYRLSRTIARAANAQLRADDTVIVSGYDEPSTFFYLDRPGRVILPEWLAEAAAVQPSPPLMIATDRALENAGLTHLTARHGWRRITGFNYVKGQEVTAWIGRYGPE